MLTPLLPNQERTRNLRLMMYVFIILLLIESIAVLFEINLLKDIDAGGDYTDDTLTLNDGIRGLLAIARIMLLVISVVFFVRWMVRTYLNYERASQGTTTYTKGQVQWAFFIPIVNLVRPYQIVKEAYEGMQLVLQRHAGRIEPANAFIVGVWWFCWIVQNVVGNISTRLMDDESIAGMITADWVEIFHNLIVAAGAVAVIQMLKGFETFEQEYEALVKIEQLEGMGETDSAYEG